MSLSKKPAPPPVPQWMKDVRAKACRLGKVTYEDLISTRRDRTTVRCRACIVAEIVERGGSWWDAGYVAGYAYMSSGAVIRALRIFDRIVKEQSK